MSRIMQLHLVFLLACIGLIHCAHLVDFSQMLAHRQASNVKRDRKFSFPFLQNFKFFSWFFFLFFLLQNFNSKLSLWILSFLLVNFWEHKLLKPCGCVWRSQSLTEERAILLILFPKRKNKLDDNRVCVCVRLSKQNLFVSLIVFAENVYMNKYTLVQVKLIQQNTDQWVFSRGNLKMSCKINVSVRDKQYVSERNCSVWNRVISDKKRQKEEEQKSTEKMRVNPREAHWSITEH